MFNKQLPKEAKRAKFRDENIPSSNINTYLRDVYGLQRYPSIRMQLKRCEYSLPHEILKTIGQLSVREVIA